MAHKKSGGAKAKQGSKTAGKRLGVKIYSGQKIKAGQIVVRQKGTKFHAGEGAGLGRDHTVFSTKDGVVSVKVLKDKKYIEVLSKV
ncbi:MAG: 50S ribosomal protein L27 [Candidatus Woykebacteria bacterium]